MATLEELAAKWRTDKLDHGYLPHYSMHLDSSFIDQIILEIGVAGGASLHMWEDYFSTAEVIGIEQFPKGIDASLNVILGDACLADTYKTIDFSKVGVVIDDGSHLADEIHKAYEIIWPQLPSGAWYVIEDLATQWHEGLGAGGFALTLIKENLLATFRGHEITEFHAYEEIVFMKKK